MAAFGELKHFEPEVEKISSYLERVDLYFTANQIADERKVAVFLSVIGAKTYSLVRDLVSPASPKDKSLEHLADILKKHFEPKPLIIAERFTFHRRNQSTSESILEYVAELRRLATHCEFGEYRDQALRDRLVCGLSRKFWSSENFGPGPIFSLKILVPRTSFFEKSGPDMKILVRP